MYGLPRSVAVPLPTLNRREFARRSAHAVLQLLEAGHSKLLEGPGARCRPFFDLFVDFCDLACRTKPKEGYDFARHLPRIAENIPLGGSKIYHYRSEEEQAAYGVWADAVVGHACSLDGRPEAAAEAFESGRAGLPVPTWAEAELVLRHGSHLVRSGEPDGPEVLERSIELWAQARRTETRPRAYFARAVLLEVSADLAEHDSESALRLLKKGAAWSRKARLTPSLLPPYDFPGYFEAEL